MVAAGPRWCWGGERGVADIVRPGDGALSDEALLKPASEAVVEEQEASLTRSGVNGAVVVAVVIVTMAPATPMGVETKPVGVVGGTEAMDEESTKFLGFFFKYLMLFRNKN